MAHFWEFVTLVGLLLMSSELFVPNKVAVNNWWSDWMGKILLKIPSLGPDWAATDSLVPIFSGSCLFWGPVLGAYRFNFLNGDNGLVWDMLRSVPTMFQSIGIFFITIVFFGFVVACNPMTRFPAFIGLSILIFNFSERAKKYGNAIYFGIQLGAYLTMAAQIRKVIFPD